MTKEMQFKKIIAQYCDVKPEEMTNDMRFRDAYGKIRLKLDKPSKYKGLS